MATIPDATNDVLNFADENNYKLPQGINVLTILTFIGCAFGLIGAIATPFLIKFSKTMMDKATEMNQDMNSAQMADITKAKHLLELTQQNIIPLTIIGLLGAIACFIGALWMRKLKKDGYLVYVAGEILPIFGSMIFLGSAQFADWKSYLGLLVPVVFVVLYSMQRKYLTK